MSLRIGIDLDGVLADMEGELIRQAENLFGAAMTKRLLEGPASKHQTTSASQDAASDSEAHAEADSTDVDLPSLAKLDMTARQERRLWRRVESIENFWEGLHELEPGIVAELARLATDRRWEIIFLTRRPQTAGRTAQVQSQRWLESKGFPLPSLYVVQGSRGAIASALALDVVLDDRPENCLDVVVDSRARAILIWREDERLLPAATRRMGVGVVKSVAECLRILTQVDGSPDGNTAGVVDRLKRLLKIKEPTTA